MGSITHSDEALNSTHVFMISFPGQGNVNPLLRLGKRLAYSGLFVTFCAPECAGQSIRGANNSNSIIDDRATPLGPGMIRFEFFDDRWPLDIPNADNLDSYMAHLELVGREKLPQMIKKHEENRRPVSCIINNPFIPWVSDVAESLGIPSAILWVQSCACFSVYYHYYHNLVSFPSEDEPEVDVRLPYMPVLKHDEIPGYLLPSFSLPLVRAALLGQFKNLSKAFCVLMDTSQGLEPEIIEYMSKLIGRPMIRTIGPLFKELEVSGSSYDSNSSAIRSDFLAPDATSVKWLDSKAPGTVVYIAFGSYVHLKQEQVDEIAYGLLRSEVSFLWVIRPVHKEPDVETPVLPHGFLEGCGDKGKIVHWSPQEKVLAHPAVACFVTHCGWNSTMEALTSGIPVVAFPHFGDQLTNAKFLVDVFNVGIMMCRGDNEGKIVPLEEVERCLRTATNGPKAARMKENALKWKQVSEEAIAEGGTSYRNMQDFVSDVVSFGRS